jgi:uncharacterized membrane protein YbhN (UPF0104 family)
MVRSALTSRWTRLALGVVSLTITAVALRIALRGLEWKSFREQMHLLDWRWLAVAVCFDIASYVAQGLRWRFLLRGAGVWQTTRAIYAGLFVNEVMPLRPGEALRAWLAARELNISPWKVLPTMVTERLLDAFWLVAAVLSALTVAPLPDVVVHAVEIVVAVLVAVTAAVWVTSKRGWTAVSTVKSGLSNGRALLWSAGFLISQGLAFWAVIRASHLSLGVFAAFAVMLVVRVGTLVPAGPANLGTHQFSTVLGLSLFGVPQSTAAAFSVVVFTVLTLPLLLIGLCACVSAGVTWSTVKTAI